MASDDCIPGYNPRRFQYVRICNCGCNMPVTVAIQTDNKRGIRQGHPVFFALGHSHRNVRISAYRRSSVVGVNLHRLRAEQAIGHPLPPGAEIHHPDEDPWNWNARLVICPDAAYHHLLHIRMRIKKAGGNPNTDKICKFCGQVKPLTEFHKGSSNRYCKACRRLYDQARQKAKNAGQG